MNLTALLLALLAPLPYWALGLPWALASGRASLAPLLGCAIAGLAAEWSMMAGLPVGRAEEALVVASAMATGWFWKQRVVARDAVLDWLPYYFVSILAVSLSPFPSIGVWSGDWLLNLQAGEAVFGGSLPAAMLQRPPLLGAAASPLWVLYDGLYPFQITVAIASASALTATLEFLRSLRPRATWTWLGPLMLSPFFLHNTAAAWAKLFAGAFVILSIMEACRRRRTASAVFFALALAGHEGFVIWGPFVLSLWLEKDDGRFLRVVKAGSAMVIAGALLAGPLIFWILWKHGLHAKIAANPSMTTREAIVNDPMPVSIRMLLSVVTAFVGWSPLLDLWGWFHRSDAFAKARIAREVYWIVTSWVSTLTGTLFGFLLPFLFVWRRWLRNLTATQPAVFAGWPLAGVAIAVVLNGAIAGVYAPWGMAQAALSPLVLGLYALLIAAIDPVTAPGRNGFRRLMWASAVLGGLPWLIMNLGTSVALWRSAGFRESMRIGSESDYIAVLENGLESLGMTAFPLVPVTFLVLLVLWLRGARLRFVRPDHFVPPRGD